MPFPTYRLSTPCKRSTVIPPPAMAWRSSLLLPYIRHPSMCRVSKCRSPKDRARQFVSRLVDTPKSSTLPSGFVMNAWTWLGPSRSLVVKFARRGRSECYAPSRNGSIRVFISLGVSSDPRCSCSCYFDMSCPCWRCAVREWVVGTGAGAGVGVGAVACRWCRCFRSHAYIRIAADTSCQSF